MASFDSLESALAGPSTILVRNATRVSKLIAGLRVENKTDTTEYAAHVATLAGYRAKVNEMSARAAQAPSRRHQPPDRQGARVRGRVGLPGQARARPGEGRRR